MIELPDDRKREIALKIVDIFCASTDTLELVKRAIASLPDDPSIAEGFYAGFATGRLYEQAKTRSVLDKAKDELE
ncbi:hypothetical protein M0R72_20450 [Candidatus Pacearchaeota archaeon]|jgi:hypothetical protein|nr:hypothetical protein [Candidatus Pacearchaeota archaeon]